jgi:transcriptional regulator with XRE-family HTH domain
MHALPARHFARLVNLSSQSISELMGGHRSPSLNTLTLLSEFFEISSDRFRTATFAELLADELADLNRFHRVEDKIPDEARARAWHSNA